MLYDVMSHVPLWLFKNHAGLAIKKNQNVEGKKFLLSDHFTIKVTIIAGLTSGTLLLCCNDGKTSLYL